MLAGRAASVARHFVPANTRAGRRCEELAVRATPLSTWTDDHRVFGYPLARRLVGGSPPPSNGATAARLLALLPSTWREESPVGFSCLLDVTAYMGCQLLRDCDAVSMAHSLELRVPLVDTRVAEFARSCPDDFKLHPCGGRGPEYEASGAKRVLIHALRDVLPTDISRRLKRGFALPYDHWVRQDLAPLVEETCSREAVADRGLLDPDLVERLRSDWHGWPQAWSVMILELWCRAQEHA
jgi:asparagine synthetase B (glutamine-hydrolysing)